MASIHRPTLAGLVLCLALATPAFAGMSPYVRLDFGGNELRMTDGDQLIQASEASLKAAGYPADFQNVGTGYGPGGSVGLWILPGFRIGASYSSLRSVRQNRLNVPGQLDYADDLDFRMNEVGVEAAVRFERLAGLTLGANVAEGSAKLIEGYSAEDAFSQLHQDATAHGTKTTFGGYIGFDQTNSARIAGFIRAGFQYREVGRLPSDLTISDGTTTTKATGRTVWLDYSGYYVKVGVGYDLAR